MVEENERLLSQCSELRVTCEGHRRKVSLCQEENILLMAEGEKARLYSLALEEKKNVEKELDMYKNRSDYLEQKQGDYERRIAMLESENERYRKRAEEGEYKLLRAEKELSDGQGQHYSQ